MYEKAIDRESACEKLKGRVVASAMQRSEVSVDSPFNSGDEWGNSSGNAPAAPTLIFASNHTANQQQPAPSAPEAGGIGGALNDMFGNLFGSDKGKRRNDNAAETMVKSAVRTIGSQVGREIIRGVLG